MKLEEINQALDWVNNIKSTYDFVEFDKKTNKKHKKLTIENLEEIIDACNQAIKLIKGE